MAKKRGKLIWAIVVTVIAAIAVNLGLGFLAETVSYGLALSPLISAINLVITGFSAGLGFYLAKSILE
jgi:hypothetical protein